MRLIRKVAKIIKSGGVSSHARREPPGKAERAREKAAQAQVMRAEAEAKVAEEQAAALARAVHEDEAHGQADLREVAEKEARPCRSGHHPPDSGMEGDRPTLTAWVILGISRRAPEADHGGAQRHTQPRPAEKTRPRWRAHHRGPAGKGERRFSRLPAR